MAPRRTLQGLAHASLLLGLLGTAACGPVRDPIATERPSPPPGTFVFPYVDPSIPGAPTAFTGPAGDAAGAPRIVYPLDGAMHPVNIGQITFQWSRGAPQSRVFRLALT